MPSNRQFAEHLIRRGLKPLAVLAARKPHGTRLRYMSGCKCVPCRAANSRYETGRLLARKNGDWNGIISAGRARRHLLLLSEAGVGRRRVEEVSGVPNSILQEIKHGVRRRIRARTSRKILAVHADVHRAGASYVPADSTWLRIKELLVEGFTKGRIAQEALGNKGRALQLRKDRILARSARKIQAFYDRYMY